MDETKLIAALGVSSALAVSETDERNDTLDATESAVEPVSETEERKDAVADVVSAVDAVSDTDAVYNPPPAVARGSWANAAFPNIY
jgi:hypothetical protein